MKKNFFNVVILLLMGLFLVSCGGQKQDAAKESPQGENGKLTVKVGTEGTFAPFSYMDDKDNLTGYDIEVVREIGKRANIDFEFIPTPWDGMFLGLESGKFDMIANQVTKNPEREEKYAFSDDYLTTGAQIIVKKGRTDIKSLDDLKGKKVLICLGCNYQKMLTEYDTKNEINPGNYEGSETIALEEIAEGKIDATIHDRLVAAYFNKKKGSELIETVGDVMEKKSVYFVYRKDAKSEEIKNRMNKALEEMKKDGTLAKLSMQWFNEDYTK